MRKEGVGEDGISDGRAKPIKSIFLTYLHDADQCGFSWTENIPLLKEFQYSFKNT